MGFFFLSFILLICRLANARSRFGRWIYTLLRLWSWLIIGPLLYIHTYTYIQTFGPVLHTKIPVLEWRAVKRNARAWRTNATLFYTPECYICIYYINIHIYSLRIVWRYSSICVKFVWCLLRNVQHSHCNCIWINYISRI